MSQTLSDGKVYRESWNTGISIEPTDTWDCCVLYTPEGRSAKRWNPSKEDLVAIDWQYD
jgi:hypothetical protein